MDAHRREHTADRVARHASSQHRVAAIVAPVIVAVVCAFTIDARATPPIVGGEQAAVGDFPTVVAITYPNAICTGTLIAPAFVLTAGHCIEPGIVGAADEATMVSSMRVRFDTVDATRTGGKVVKAKRVIHGGFDANQIGKHDIGLVELASAVTDRTPSRVNIDAGAAPVGVTTTMVGFGSTSGTSHDPGIEYVLENRVSGPCATVIGAGATDANLLCFSQTDDKGKCEGDSGGPSFAEIDGERFVVGVTSFGDQSCAVFGADTRTNVEADFLLGNVTDICVTADCAAPPESGGCCDSGRNTTGSIALALGVAAIARRRRR